MCGIVGIVSRGTDVSRDLVRGIRRLEYRGYDSCGVAVRNGKGFVVAKEVGGPSEVSNQDAFTALHGEMGIAHTRWATHGGVSRANAHPHLSSAGTVVLVHNGVLTNYRELRRELVARGYQIRSETDSEIASHLIEDKLSTGLEPRAAIFAALAEMQGTYALAIMIESDPGHLYAVRQESPLVVGFALDQVVVASDPLAISAQCTELQYVEDGELVEITAESSTIYSIATGEVIHRERRPIGEAQEDPELGEFAHFMAKEMAESGAAARATLTLEDEQFERAATTLVESQRTFLTGMGTAYHMAYFGHHLVASFARIFCPVVTADELPDVVWFQPDDAVLGVSQSGETYDTLRALRRAHEAGARTLAVVNVAGSSMAREVDQALLQAAGPEVAVLATKSAFSQAMILARIALEAGRQNQHLSSQRYLELRTELEDMPQVLQEWRPRIEEQARETAARFLGLEKWFFLGRGLFAAVALEGALKFKEVTYRHAEGMAAGLLKHGTISLIDPEMGTAMFLPPACAGELRELTMTALEEVRSRGGPMLAVGAMSEDERTQVDACIETPGKSMVQDALLQIVAGQYLAYYTARALGRDIDRPRALAKSVTVP